MSVRIFLLLAILVHCRVSTLGKPMFDIEAVKDVNTEENYVEDPEIEEIAKREYETVHGQILAVNMAHWEKRKMKMRDEEENSTNVFESIEKDNDRHHLNLYQGDIKMDEDLENYLHMPVRSRTKRNAQRTRTRLWTSRIIPYTVPSFMQKIRKNLMIAIGEYHKYTCLRFVPYKPGVHRNYITFDQSDGCSSRIGKKYFAPGRQTVSIGPGCNYPGTIIHELLHALGFFHEQARSDRDKYVEIKWENILRGFDDQFEKYDWRDIDQLGQSYDFESIMHYDRKAFSKNNQPTIVAIGNENQRFGTKDKRLSKMDIIEINALYDCKVKQYGWTKWSEFTPCNAKCYRIRERYCFHPGNLKYCGGKVNNYGIEKDERKCTKLECLARNAINGHWGHWSSWTDCSVKCNDGVRSRVRQCINPAPSKYGKKCKGKSKDVELCSVNRCSKDFEDTDFDDRKRPLGMWKNKPGTQIQWARHKGFTQTMETGPMRDHTTGKGYYLYMESSGYGMKGKQAKLISPLLKSKPGGQCLKFYYTMYGKTMGSLEVRVIQNGRKVRMPFFKKGDQGPTWHLATGTLDIKGKFKLEFIATVGDRGYSDIAIDDVYIDDGKCSCQDKYISCSALWTGKGECRKNKKWMSENCPRSCKICGTTLVQPVSGVVSMVPYGICKDKNPKCPKWATSGECNKNKEWMHQNCAKSCRVCESCVDDEQYKDNCPKWAKEKQCIKNKKWMEDHCRKSCNTCSCSNKNEKCYEWAKSGECNKNKDWMHKNCKKACGGCG